MRPRSNVTSSCVIGLLLLYGASSTARAQIAGAGDPPDVGIDQRLGASVPLDLELYDESGDIVSLDDLIGDKPAILALVYYKCPMLCGQVLNGLLDALEELTLDVGSDFTVLTVSFDPQETPHLAGTKKKKYLARYDRPGAERGWRFLTGESRAVRALADAVGFRYTYDEETKQFAHAAGIMILTPDGRIARYYYGIEYPPRDLRLGLVEASAGAIGSPVDQLLLLCYHYDPTRGRYGLVIMNVVRLGGVVTVLAITSLVAALLYRERRTRTRVSSTAAGSGGRGREGEDDRA